MDEKMATDSHSRYCRGSERGHNRKEKADAKANGIRQQLTGAEYWKEIAEINEKFNKLERMIEEIQRAGWLMKKRVKWQPLQLRLRQKEIALLKEELKIAELRKEVSTCEADKSTGEEWRSAKDLMNHGGGLRQQEFCLAEEEIKDNFLSYWTSLDQLDDVEPCIFVTDNCGVITSFTKEDGKYCEVVTSMKKYLSEDR